MIEQFIEWKPRTSSVYLLNVVNSVLDEIKEPVTLRQLFARLVLDGKITDNAKAYDNLGDLLAKARLAGVVDWDAITDGPSRMTGEVGPFPREIWIDREALVPQVFDAAKPWGIPVVFYRANPTLDMVYRLAKRQTNVLHFRSPGSTVDLAERLEVFGIDCETIGAPDIDVYEYDLDSFDPQALREAIADAIAREIGPPIRNVPTFDFDWKAHYQDVSTRFNAISGGILDAMADTADTTRASALKKKIEAILNG